MDISTKLSRQRGSLPDRYWNQLNGQSIAENYRQFKAQQQEVPDEGPEEIYITYEVKMK